MMQPLDAGVMKPFQTYYSAAVDTRMRAYPGQSLTIYDVSASVAAIHSRAMTPETIIN